MSLADIAARVGIHKSALLRYFETREQIFLELTAQAWREWTSALHAEAPWRSRDGLRMIGLWARQPPPAGATAGPVRLPLAGG